MLKAIRFKDVRPGDVVCKEADRPRKVGAVSEERDPYIQLFTREGGFFQGKPEEVIGLLHRPWPEGKPKWQMLTELGRASAVVAAMIAQVDYDEDIFRAQVAFLRNALDAYELGKPQAD